MYDYQVALVTIGTIIGLASFYPYYRDIVKGTTKPHVFSWLIWSLLVGITFFIQLAEGGGIGAIVTGIESLCCFGITLFAYTRGEKIIPFTDWICLFLAIAAIVLWQGADQPLLAVLFIILADFFAFLPTFRKSYNRPYQETISQFAMSSVRWFLVIPALETLTLTTFLYPLWCGVLDGVLVATLVIRRKQLPTKIKGN